MIYQRGPGALDCADEPTVRAALIDSLAYDPFGDGPLTLTATIDRVGAKLVSQIELSDADGLSLGTRTLSGDTCADVVAAMVLIIVITVEPFKDTSHKANADDKTDPWTGSLAPRADADKAAIVKPKSPARRLDDIASPTNARVSPSKAAIVHRWQASISLGIAAALDSALKPTVGFTGQFAVTRRYLKLGIELRGDLPAGSEQLDARGQTALTIGLLVPCLRNTLGGVCALVALGSERGAIDTRVAWAFYAAVGGRLFVDVPLPRPFTIGVHADVLAPIARTVLDIATSAAYSVELGMALELHYR